MTTQTFLFSYLILAGISNPLLSLPMIDSREVSYPFPDTKINVGELSNLDQAYLLQNLPSFLNKHNSIGDTDAMLSKEELSEGNENLGEDVKEVIFGKHPHISLLSLLQSKDRKQYKKRGNLSECFWKYCV